MLTGADAASRSRRTCRAYQGGFEVGGQRHRLEHRDVRSAGVAAWIPPKDRAHRREYQARELSKDFARVMLAECHTQHRGVYAGVQCRGRLRQDVCALEAAPRIGPISTERGKACELPLAPDVRGQGLPPCSEFHTREPGIPTRRKQQEVPRDGGQGRGESPASIRVLSHRPVVEAP